MASGGLLLGGDEELAARAMRGDEAAFHQIVDRHGYRLYRAALSLTGNPADAEDVVQETLAGAFRGLGGFRREASLATWLLRILLRQAARVRRARSRRMVSLDAAAETSADPALAQPSHAGAVECSIDVAAALRRLSPEHREVLVLREMEGLSYDEMARALGVPRGTVESRLHRAREAMRQLLAGTMGEP